MFNNRGKLLSSSKPEESVQNSWPYGRRQELVKRWFGRESPLTELSEGKPKPGLVQAATYPYWQTYYQKRRRERQEFVSSC